MFSPEVIHMIILGIGQTLYMVILSTLFGYVLGLPWGIALAVTNSAAPFIARMVESSLMEVDPGVIEAAESMGADAFTIITKVLLVEARVSLIVGVTICFGTILGYSAMAGAVGGGGLGDIAIRYGYHRYQADVMIVTVILLVILQQIFQYAGMFLSNRIDRRRV